MLISVADLSKNDVLMQVVDWSTDLEDPKRSRKCKNMILSPEITKMGIFCPPGSNPRQIDPIFGAESERSFARKPML